MLQAIWSRSSRADDTFRIHWVSGYRNLRNERRGSATRNKGLNLASLKARKDGERVSQVNEMENLHLNCLLTRRHEQC